MKDGTQDGFTLVEVLVAFAILAGTIILTFQIFADGIHRLTTVEARTRAVSIARSELARLTIPNDISEGTTSGTTDGVAWTITVTPLNGTDAAGASAMRPFKVEVRVPEAGSGPVIETVLLGRPSQP